ncbi:MAG: 8-oxoguanine DNA glycosylase, N-terminal domain-containing protein, partial [Eubacteriales bacterium]|nr:8-oxoguanine DNA glycosylase, N-terminal domain-containing protein [Eubacteriales bacterium]
MPVTVAADCFDPFVIMDSGQCFRMIPVGPVTVETVAFGCRLLVTKLEDGRYSFDCTQADFDQLWRPYFDLDT